MHMQGVMQVVRKHPGLLAHARAHSSSRFTAVLTCLSGQTMCAWELLGIAI